MSDLCKIDDIHHLFAYNQIILNLAIMKKGLRIISTTLFFLLISLLLQAQTTFYESLDGFTANQNIVAQDSIEGNGNWRLWSGNANEDAVVSTNQSLTTNNSIFIQSSDDIVYYPGSFTSGRWFFSGHIFIPTGNSAFFNMMHNWANYSYEWAFQVFFQANGTGRLNVGGNNYNFSYNHNEWLYISVEIDMANDLAKLWVNNQLIRAWPWHYSPTGTSGQNKFESVNFFGWNDEPSKGLFYVDELTFSSNAIVRLENKTTTWSGTAKQVTVKTYPPNLPYTVTYNGSSTLPVEPGKYIVNASITNPLYPGSATDTFIINKINAAVSISNISQTYNGTAKPVTVATNPAGLPTLVTYNGSSSIPVNAGKYVVVATINDPHYQGSITDTLVISRALVTITLSNITQIYSGLAKSVTVTTNPAGLTTVVTYNGSSVNPVNSGYYSVAVRIVDANYVGNITSALTIRKANAIIMVTGLTKTYNGAPQGITVQTIPEGLTYSVSYNGSASQPVNAAIYNTSVVINDANYQGLANSFFSILKAQAKIDVSETEVIYDGNAKSVNLSTVPTGLLVDVTYNGSSTIPVNAGLYKIAAIVRDLNYQGSVNDTLLVSKAPVIVEISDMEAVYDGIAKPVTISTTPSALKYKTTYNGYTSVPIIAGSYAVEVVITNPNYQGTASDTLIIKKADASISLTCSDIDYDGQAHIAMAQTSPIGLNYTILYNGSEDFPVNAGMYVVQASIDNENYAGEAIDTLIIRKKRAQINLSELITTYDGTEKQPVVKTTPSKLSVEFLFNGLNTNPIDAGTYVIEASINSENYSGVVFDTLVIEKAQQVISWDQNLCGHAPGETLELEAKASNNQDVYYTSSNPVVSDVLGSRLILKGMGQATIIAHLNGNNNFHEASPVSKIVEVTSSSIEEEISSIIKCWPNPVSDNLTIGIDSDKEVEVSIYNQTGALMILKNISGLNPQIDLSELATGIYILKMNYNNTNYSLKVSRQ